MFKPPFVVQANIATAPLFAVDKSLFASHVRVVKPVIAVTPNIPLIAPIVILLAVRRKMDIAATCIARCNFVVKCEPLPCVHLFQRNLVIPASVNLRHDAFNPMPEIFKHFSDASLVVEPHDDEVAFKAFVNEWFGVAPVSIWSDHMRFPIAKVGSTE